MKREEFDQLLDFCVGQLRNFDAAAWLGAPVAARGRLAVVASFLGASAWYGNSEQRTALAALAPQLDARAQTLQGLGQLAREQHFDFPRFSSMLRRRIAHELQAVA